MNYKINSLLLKQVFELLDYDKDGQVDIDEALDNMELLRLDESHPEICELVAGVGKGKVTFNQFEQKINELLHDTREDEGLQKTYDLFVYNPKQSDVDRQSLNNILNDLGEEFSEMDKDFDVSLFGEERSIKVCDDGMLLYINPETGKIYDLMAHEDYHLYEAIEIIEDIAIEYGDLKVIRWLE